MGGWGSHDRGPWNFCPMALLPKVKKKVSTLPETNIAPENGWLDYQFPFGMTYFQGLC